MLETYLFENRQQYAQMMQPLLDVSALNKDGVDGIIHHARKFKRNDRVVWYLKWYRYMRVQVLQSTWGSSSPHLQKLSDKFKKSLPPHDDRTEGYEFGDFSSPQFIDHWMNSIETMPRVNDIVWQNQTPSELKRELAEAESEYTKKFSNAIYMSNYDVPWEKVIDYGDTAWVLLHKGACDQEAQAMGHCGNVPSVKEGDRILSYRNIRDNDIHQPHLTFILDGNGYLGEMKGRANEKPKPKYHTVIVDLLKQDFIKGIKGGGYAADRNFELRDLPTDTKDALQDEYPKFQDALYKLKRGRKLSDHDIQQMQATISMSLSLGNFGISGGLEYNPNDGSMLLHTFSSLSALHRQLIGTSDSFGQFYTPNLHRFLYQVHYGFDIDTVFFNISDEQFNKFRSYLEMSEGEFDGMTREQIYNEVFDGSNQNRKWVDSTYMLTNIIREIKARDIAPKVVEMIKPVLEKNGIHEIDGNFEWVINREQLISMLSAAEQDQDASALDGIDFVDLDSDPWNEELKNKLIDVPTIRKMFDEKFSTTITSNESVDRMRKLAGIT
jgi:hypothetical protein